MFSARWLRESAIFRGFLMNMTLDAETVDTKSRTRQKRQATESSIIDAFEAVLERDGARSIGVNRVIKEARIGKGLLYKYFGGLPGLVRAWAQRRQIWPDFKSLLKNTDHAEIDARQAMKNMLFAYAQALRDRPVALEILAEELLSPSVLTEAFAQARLDFGKDQLEVFQSVRGLEDPTNRSLMIILAAAATYLAMRARAAPLYMGIHLDTEDGWEEVISSIDKIIEIAGQNDPVAEKQNARGTPFSGSTHQ